MIKATLYRQFYNKKEYKYITVDNIADIQKYCLNCFTFYGGGQNGKII